MDFLKNKKVLIIIFIFIFVILAALNFYNIKDTIKNNVIEPFEAELDEDQNVGQNKVIIDNTDNVNFNSFGTIKTGTNLTNLLKTAGNWNLTWNAYNKNSVARNEGGAISLGNPNKSDDNTKVDNWTLFNMTGHYGNGLHFYKYSGGISNNDNAKFVNRGTQFALWDNGVSQFMGSLVVNDTLWVKSMSFDGTTINASGGRMHISGTELLYILNKNGVIIGKDWGGNGNLIVGGDLTVNGKTNTPGGINAGSGLIETTHIVKAGGIESGWIKANSTLEVTGVATLRGGVSSTSATFSGDLTVNGKINGNLGATNITAVNKYSTDTSAWWRNNGTGSFVIACSTVPAAQGCIKIETTHWDTGVPPKPTFSTINCNGRLHILSSEMILLMGPSTMIHKSPGVGASGDLIVQGNASFDNRVDINNKVRLGLTNPTSPNHLTCISDRGIQFGGDNAGREVNSAQITAGMHIANSLNIVGMSTGTNWTTRRIDMWAEGGCNIYGRLSVNGDLYSGNFRVDSGSNWTSIGNSAGRMHVYGGELLYILNKSGVMIGKEWGGSGNLVVQGNIQVKEGTLYVGPDLTMFSRGSSVNFNTGSRHIDFEGNEFFNIYNRLGLAVRRGQTYGDFRWFSDIRLKENIKTINENEKDKVLQLVPKTYNLIADEKKTKRYGFIAQEVEELYPELVSIDDKGMKAVNYSDLIPLLLEQIKELKKSIPNQNVLNIGGVTLTANELQKLKQLLNQ